MQLKCSQPVLQSVLLHSMFLWLGVGFIKSDWNDIGMWDLGLISANKHISDKTLVCTDICIPIMFVLYMCVYSLVTKFDEVQVCGGRRQPADIQVGFAELLQACAAAVAAAAGTGRSHGVGLHTENTLLGSVREPDNLISTEVNRDHKSISSVWDENAESSQRGHIQILLFREHDTLKMSLLFS